MSAGIPRQDNEYSLEGTLAHDLAATRLLGKHWRDKDRPIPDGMESNVRVYTRYVKDTAAKKRLWVEQEVALDEERFGTADAIVWHEEIGVLEVIDLKYGAGMLVEVEDNPQLLYYALATYRTFRAQGVNPKGIRITIAQPRAEHYEGPIRTRDVDVFDLLEWGAWLDERSEATKDPNAPIVAGSHCKFCPAKATCPGLREQALAVAQSEFGDDPFSPPTVEGMTAEQMGEVLKRAPILEEWLSAIRERVFADLQSGKPVPGWKLVAKRAQRKWTDEKALWRDLHDNYGVGYSDAHETPKMKSPAQMEKALPKSLLPLLEKYTVKESSGETLAPDSDRREPVVKLSAPEEFAS